MTLTTVIGSSGSGKTTFVEDVYKLHKCIYIRQYHNVRPYVTVTKIPNFDPTQLPYWDSIVKDGRSQSVQVGGTMGGEYTPGLSGGQRKLLLFELIYQRTKAKSNLLIALDEPFAGVTDDFMPYVNERLAVMKKNHNVVVVSNDHVETLNCMADNVMEISALDRSVVTLNGNSKVDRKKAMLALSYGKQYVYTSSSADFMFFLNTEIIYNEELRWFAFYAALMAGLFTLTFWNSSAESATLILIAADAVSFYALNPYMLSLAEWRVYMVEEAEALLHASQRLNYILKTTLAVSMTLMNSSLLYGVVNITVGGAFLSLQFWVAVAVDCWFMNWPYVCLAIYSRLPVAKIQALSSLPELLEIFFSTTFSPGAGVEVVKELRYLFPKFYFWCMIPSIQDDMEGCVPEQWNLLFLVFSGFLPFVVFLLIKAILSARKGTQKVKNAAEWDRLKDTEFQILVSEMYGGECKFMSEHQVEGLEETGSSTPCASAAEESA